MNRAPLAAAAAVMALTYGGSAGGGKSAALEGTRGIDEIARRQREVEKRRGDLKRATRTAVVALVQSEERLTSVRHIHPRWLRAAVEALMDAGQTVTTDDVEALRAAGRPSHG